MTSSISLKTLENSIDECTRHLKFLKESSSITKELIDFLQSKNLGESLLENLNTGADISNIHCIVTLTELEISIILKSLYNSNHDIESKQIIKNGVLLIYETIKTLDMLGNKLKQLSGQYPDYKSDFNNYYGGMKKFKKNIKIDSTYKIIRNGIAGHRVPNSSQYIKIVDSIDIEEQKYYLIQFKMLIDLLNKFLFKCFDESNKTTN